jgi:hypothetical protein
MSHADGTRQASRTTPCAVIWCTAPVEVSIPASDFMLRKRQGVFWPWLRTHQ